MPTGSNKSSLAFKISLTSKFLEHLVWKILKDSVLEFVAVLAKRFGNPPGGFVQYLTNITTKIIVICK